MTEAESPLLSARALSRRFGARAACQDVSLDIHEGEVLAIVGESGSGKSTLLGLLSTELTASSGNVTYRLRDGTPRDLDGLSEAERRRLLRSEWGFVRQDARDGLRM